MAPPPQYFSDLLLPTPVTTTAPLQACITSHGDHHLSLWPSLSPVSFLLHPTIHTSPELSLELQFNYTTFLLNTLQNLPIAFRIKPKVLPRAYKALTYLSRMWFTTILINTQATLNALSPYPPSPRLVSDGHACLFLSPALWSQIPFLLPARPQLGQAAPQGSLCSLRSQLTASPHASLRRGNSLNSLSDP